MLAVCRIGRESSTAWQPSEREPPRLPRQPGPGPRRSLGPARPGGVRGASLRPQSRVYARFRPLTLYLGGVLGRPLRLVIASTYDEQIEMIATGQADFAYIGPTPYVRARARGDVEILAGEAESGQAFYQSALVVRADSAIRRVADLAGRRIALGAEISMSGAIAPKQIQAGGRMT